MACPAAGGSGENGRDNGEEERRLVKKEIVVETGFSDGSIQSKKVVRNIDYGDGEGAASQAQAAGPSLGAIPKRPQVKCSAGRQRTRDTEEKTPERRQCQRRRLEAQPDRRLPEVDENQGLTDEEVVDRIFEPTTTPPHWPPGPPSPPTPHRVARPPSRFPRQSGAKTPDPPGTSRPRLWVPRERTDEEVGNLCGELRFHQSLNYSKSNGPRRREAKKRSVSSRLGYQPPRHIFNIGESSTPEDVVEEIAAYYQGMKPPAPLRKSSSKLKNKRTKSIRKKIRKVIRKTPKAMQRLQSMWTMDCTEAAEPNVSDIDEIDEDCICDIVPQRWCRVHRNEDGR